jgi:hypothetical protein
MTALERDYDELIRRTLHAIAGPIEPVGDGLARIQRRIAQPWHRRQLELLRAESADLASLMLVRCEPGFDRLKAWLATWLKAATPALDRISPAFDRISPAFERIRGSLRPQPGVRWSDWRVWPRSAFAWLRASLAVGTVALIVMAAVYAVNVTQSGGTTQIAGTAQNGQSGQQPGSAGNSPGGIAPAGSTAASDSPGGQSGTLGPRTAQHPARATCSPTPTPSATGSVPGTASPTPTTPSPTPTTASPSPTDTATSSPSPTDTGTAPTPAPMASAPAAGGGQATTAASGNVTTKVVREGSTRPVATSTGGCGGTPSASPSPSGG